MVSSECDPVAVAVADPVAPSAAVPAMFAFCGAGIAAMGFGAGFGSRAYQGSDAYKSLLEDFPKQPTPEAEAMARRGGIRAFMYGTGLAGLMGVGAFLVARRNGINSAAEFGDEIKKWLPSSERLDVTLSPALKPIQRMASEHMQVARGALTPPHASRTAHPYPAPNTDTAEHKFRSSELGRTISRTANAALQPHTQKPLQPWEKDIVDAIEGVKPAVAR